jgi:hypothetical protein
MNGALESPDRQAWRGALIATMLNALGMPLDLVLGWTVPDMPRWASVLSALVGASLALLLLVRRRRPTRRLAEWTFSLNNVVILFALWMTSSAYAHMPNWLPFQANKLGALAASLLAPSLWTGLSSIVAFVGTAILKIQVIPRSVRIHLPLGEPWALLIYGVFGVALLVHRVRGLEFERRLLRAQSEAAAAQELARTLLAVRDFANTPIQTLELGTDLIRRNHPELSPLLDRLDRSIARLMELNRLLLTYERHLKWAPGEESFDSGGVLGPRPS